MVSRKALDLAFDVALDLSMVAERILVVEHLCNVLGFRLGVGFDPSGVVRSTIEVAFDVVKLAGSRFVSFSVHGVDSSKLEGGCKRESWKIVWHTSWVT